MISVICYGRNDQHGYNYHKRVAISLNCIAANLSELNDEIIFVDYNTPDNLPVLPYALADTLTDKAKMRLRILRVRPRQHNGISESSTYNVIESVARNVGVRRSNASNRWILSTNLDMLFDAKGSTLTDVVSGLPDHFYHIPRYEVPEFIWEDVDRSSPEDTIRRIAYLSRRFGLPEIVSHDESFIKYDSPGDFQLILRDDITRICGFDESMILGWHVDANIAKRLSLMYGEVGDLSNAVVGYHCGHSRMATPLQDGLSRGNSWEVYVRSVSEASLPKQSRFWGMALENIEEISLRGSSALISVLLEMPDKTELVAKSEFSAATYNADVYVPERIGPYILDILAHYPKAVIVGWCGFDHALLTLVAQVMNRLGFVKPIAVCSGFGWRNGELPEGCQFFAEAVIFDLADIFIFDWGVSALDNGTFSETSNRGERPSRSSALPLMAECITKLAVVERQKPEAQRRRVVNVNAINNDAERIVNSMFNSVRSPFTTRLRQGFIKGNIKKYSLMPDLVLHKPAMNAKQGALIRTDGSLPQAIKVTWHKPGFIVSGPYVDLSPGSHSVLVRLTASGGVWLPRLRIEITTGQGTELCAVSMPSWRRYKMFKYEIETLLEIISSDKPLLGVELRIISGGGRSFVIQAADLVS